MGLSRNASRDERYACMTLLSKLRWKCKVCGKLLVMG
jgi:hypothetical protein